MFSVSKTGQTQQLVALVEGQFGSIDVLVNNAGIFPRADLYQTDETFWDRVLGINLKGAFMMCRAAVPVMVKQGGGSIVNIGSLHSVRGEEATVAYAISKGGIVTLTRNLSKSLAKHRIRVNCIHPGWIASDGEMARWQANGQTMDTVQQQIERIPSERMQTGTDIANAVAFIASDLADQITGQTLAVDGGLGLLF